MQIKMYAESAVTVSYTHLSDEYEKKEFTDISQTVQNCIRAFSQKNNVVINLPPDKNGKLSEGDIEHLEKIVKGINSYVK